MTGPDTIALVAKARDEGLDSVLVGGNAVNLYAYRRTTFDIDLLVREEERQRWISFFEERGYVIFHATANFVRMRLGADPAGALPVDLMLADQDTFGKILGQSQQRDIGNDTHLLIPSALHLIAMKLHALRSARRVERGVDLEDVKHLIETQKIDTSNPEFQEILECYASESIKAEIIRKSDS